MPRRIDELLDRLVRPSDPPKPSAAALAAAQAVRPMPSALAAVYARTGALELPGLEWFTIDEYADVNAQPYAAHDLGGGVFFASDLGGGFFMIDETDAAGEGAGAVLWVDRASFVAEDAVYCRPHILDFIEAAAEGERACIENEPLGRRDERTFFVHVDRATAVDARPGATIEELDAVEEKGFALPFPLWNLYERANGLRFARSGIEILPLALIEPVPGTTLDNGEPGAAWFAVAADGRRFAFSLGWMGLPDARVIEIAAADLANARVLGRLFKVLDGWAGPDEGG